MPSNITVKSLDDFEVMSVLGQGAFGTVKMVKHKEVRVTPPNHHQSAFVGVVTGAAMTTPCHVAGHTNEHAPFPSHPPSVLVSFFFSSFVLSFPFLFWFCFCLACRRVRRWP